jgi:hypothetical protein
LAWELDEEVSQLTQLGDSPGVDGHDASSRAALSVASAGRNSVASSSSDSASRSRVVGSDPVLERDRKDLGGHGRPPLPRFASVLSKSLTSSGREGT